MITPRGWWLLALTGGLLGAAVYVGTPTLILVCLTVLCWFLGSLLGFALRLRLLHNKVYVLRQLYDDQGPVASLWADRTYRVRVQLRSDSLLPSAYLRNTDRLPYGVKLADGALHADGTVIDGRPVEISYRLQTEAPGRVRFEGLQVQVADLQGLFYHTFFVRAAQVYRVLPPFADIKGQVPAVKRYNLLPTSGHHRYRRPGSGSELLDLRDYIPGDPPRTIAWKVSARRDKLITKEFESEVPIRCTFFVDTSHTVRVGPVGDNALARLVEVTAALVQASAGQRDLPGLCLFDQDRVSAFVRPARNSRHVIQVFNVLADAAGLAPATPKVDALDLLPLAYGFAEEVYPDLLRKEVNHFPWWQPWWAPRFMSKRERRMFWNRVITGFVMTVALLAAVILLPPHIFRLLLIVLAPTAAFLLIVNLGRRFSRGAQGLPTERNPVLYRWRKKLSAVLSVRHGLAPQGLGELLEDDQRFAEHAQRFLADHQVPYAVPLYSPKGEYLYQAPGKVDVLARALLGAVARGKDNELFVLLVDLLETEPLDTLMRAVKVAVARHHQVVVLCPWPPGVPLPGTEPEETAPIDSLPDLRSLATTTGLRRFLESQTVARLHRAFFRLRRTFGRVGVVVHCAAHADAARLILNRLRTMRSQLQGVR